MMMISPRMRAKMERVDLPQLATTHISILKVNQLFTNQMQDSKITQMYLKIY